MIEFIALVIESYIQVGLALGGCVFGFIIGSAACGWKEVRLGENLEAKLKSGFRSIPHWIKVFLLCIVGGAFAWPWFLSKAEVSIDFS